MTTRRIILILMLSTFMSIGLISSASDNGVGQGSSASEPATQATSSPTSHPVAGEADVLGQQQMLESGQRQLWQGGVGALKDNGSAADLRRAIDSLRATLEKPVPPRIFTTEPELPPLDQMVEATSKPAATSMPAEKLTPQEITEALEMIKKTGLDNFAYPLKVADRLYANGNRQASAVFYDLASRSAKISQNDKAWALFQIGNSLADCDLAAARAAYAQLIAEMPKSEWIEIAKMKDAALQWRQENNLQKLSVEDALKEIRQK